MKSRQVTLGLPPITLTPTVQPIANGWEWRWFDPSAHVAIWQGPVWQHGFPASSLEEALARVGWRLAHRSSPESS